MDRRTLTEGFVMAEVLTAFAIVSLLCAVFASSVHIYEPDPDHLFPSDYLLTQSEAMANAQSTPLQSRVADLPAIRFSEKGNVSKAMTLRFGTDDHDIIVELGPGKLVFR
jgi:hypothetical protein